MKKSLQQLSKAINGDAKTEPQTLFKVSWHSTEIPTRNKKQALIQAGFLMRERARLTLTLVQHTGSRISYVGEGTSHTNTGPAYRLPDFFYSGEYQFAFLALLGASVLRAPRKRAFGIC